MPIWRKTACINQLDDYIEATHVAAVHCKTLCIGSNLCAKILGFHIHSDKCPRTLMSGRIAQYKYYLVPAPFRSLKF